MDVPRDTLRIFISLVRDIYRKITDMYTNLADSIIGINKWCCCICVVLYRCLTNSLNIFVDFVARKCDGWS